MAYRRLTRALEAPKPVVQAKLAAAIAAPNVSHSPLSHPMAASVPLGSPHQAGLPKALKAGIETLSGIAMDDVRVHRGSARPAAIGAHAYAQGRDIHLAPGQERHLPHEAWHVVQQKQGRVRADGATRGGTPLNESPALEREGDTMGNAAGDAARGASAAAPRATAAPLATAAMPAQAAAIQMVKKRTHDQTLWEKNPDVFRNVNNWISLVDEFEPEILAVRENIADYTDGTKANIAYHKLELAKIEQQLDNAISDGNVLMDEIDEDDGEFLRSEFELREIYGRILDLLANFQRLFLPSGGGFSASARSTEIAKVEITRQKKAKPHAFFRNIKIGDRDLNYYHVKKPPTAPDPGKIVLRSGSTYYYDDEYEIGDDLPDFDHSALDSPMGSTADSVQKFHPKKRDTTQDGAMGGVSARTYAWMSNTPGWDTQKWEWLHLRAASLGGATDAENLVLGTRDANTHMMPFESNLVVLGNQLASTPNFEGITVKWSFGGQDPKWKYKVQTITIKWTVHMTGHSDTLGGKATFYPLEVNAVLSRTETKFIEKLLKKEREDLENKANWVSNKKQKLK